jgi:hypothetical protein
MFQALRATSETLKRFLDQQAAARGLPSPTVKLATPTELDHGELSGMSVWLYRVAREEHRYNDGPLRPDPHYLRRAPLPVRLHYLITPVGLTAEIEQELLGMVLQSFHDHPTLLGTDLTGAFGGTDVELTVRLEPLSLEEITRAWEALASPYRLSLSYEVSVVFIESKIDSIGPPITIVLADSELIVGATA